MYCPECGGEYREGFFTCADCEVALVAELPPAAEPEGGAGLGLVTVLTSGNPNEIAFADAVLRDAGIPVFKKGEGLQELFALGRLGVGFNPVAGPVFLQVPKEHAEQAARILEETELAELEDAEDDEEPE
ncbi:MAG: putative signal transducing protein [Thermoanaerobaculia bacterium]